MSKLLIIDDEAPILALLQSALEESARQIFVAETAREGLEIATRERPDVILIDKNLPDASGIDVAESLTRLDPRPEIVIITAYGSVESARRAMMLSVFDYVTKPFDVTAIRDIVRRAMDSAVRRRTGAPVPQTALRVLIADDDALACAFIRDALAPDGYEMEVAADGLKALERIRDLDFDVVVADVLMPGLSGIEVLARVQVESPETEVIIATAHADLDVAIRCLRAGAFDFVQKPLRAEDLRRCVRSAGAARDQRGASALYRAGQAILDRGNREHLYDVIVESAMNVMRADAASLMLADQPGKLSLVASRGLPQGASTLIEVGMDSIAGRVATDGEPVLLKDLHADARFASLEKRERVGSSIVYPLVSGANLLGVLNVSRTRISQSFRKNDLERCGFAASLIVQAFQNAQLDRQTIASERLAAIGEIATGIVHEIANPAAYVLSNVRFLRDELSAKPRYEGDVTSLVAACDDALEGVQRIREISRDIHGLVAPGTETNFDANEAIRSALRIAGVEVRRRGVLTVDLEGQLPLVGIPGRLSQVFVNLLVNAAHALDDRPAGGHSIIVRARRDGTSMEATVSDTGVGIAPEILARIFQPFFTTRGAGKGTGLGLSISRDIVSRMGGEIRAASEPGKGTTFTVRIPLASAAPGDAPAKPASPARILFVDDEPGILRAYRRMFEKTYSVTLAGDADAALAAMAGSEFDVIICDLIMPGMTGMDFFRRVQATRPEMCSRFLFMTGSRSRDDVRGFLAGAGITSLDKPWNDEELRALVASRTHRL